MFGSILKSRALLPILLAAALSLCLAPASASASTAEGGIYSLQPALADSFLSTVTVSFDTSGGTIVSPQLLESGSLVATPMPDPTWVGYAFGGWYAEAALTTPWDFPTSTVTADTTIYAKWTLSTYHVGFDSNGGSAVDTQTVAFGALVATPVPDPTRTGYTFAGWFSDAGLTTPWDFPTSTVDTDTTLYAKWTLDTYQVGFATNGGSAVDTQTVAFGGHVTRPTPDPTWTAHALLGWYSDAELTTPWDFSADTVSADRTLYAKWIRTYLITGTALHGSLSIGTSATVSAGSTPTVTMIPDSGYGIASVKIDGVSRGKVTSFTFRSVTASHTIAAAFKRRTSTTLSASAKTLSKGRYVTLYTRLNSNANRYNNPYIRFEVKLPGSSKYILLKKVRLSSAGKASYRYQVLNRGTRRHRVRFLETTYFLEAPIKRGLALSVK